LGGIFPHVIWGWMASLSCAAIVAEELITMLIKHGTPNRLIPLSKGMLIPFLERSNNVTEHSRGIKTRKGSIRSRLGDCCSSRPLPCRIPTAQARSPTRLTKETFYNAFRSDAKAPESENVDFVKRLGTPKEATPSGEQAGRIRDRIVPADKVRCGSSYIRGLVASPTLFC
jgi:hypothetical protein